MMTAMAGQMKKTCAATYQTGQQQAANATLTATALKPTTAAKSADGTRAKKKPAQMNAQTRMHTTANTAAYTGAKTLMMTGAAKKEQLTYAAQKKNALKAKANASRHHSLSSSLLKTLPTT